MPEIVSKKRNRSSDTLPNPVGKAIIMARKVAKGLDAKGAEVGIKFATGKQIRAAADVLNAAEDAYQSVLSSKTLTLSPALKAADAAGRKFIIDAKKVLSFPLGDTWNQSWAEAGFLQDSLKSPRTTVERVAALERLARYLAAHPDHEGKPQGITAEQASKLHLALSKAHDDLDAYDTLRKERRAARDKANQALRKIVADVIVEIRRRLHRESPLWEAFGLNAPKPRAARPKKGASAPQSAATRITSLESATAPFGEKAA